MTIATMDSGTRRWERWDVRATARSLAINLVAVLGAFHAYRFVRTLAEGERSAALDHGADLLRLEELLGLDIERGVQSIVLRSDRLIDLFNNVYVLTFWPVVIATLPVLFVFARPQFRHYRNGLFLSGAVGLVVFGLYPVAPPRMLDGFVDTVHVFTDTTSLARPGAFTNEYAALPSFHVGWLVLAGAAAMPAVPWRPVRPLLMLPATVMTITVMATANHYLVDALAGAAVALGALYVSHRLPTGEAVGRWVQRRLEPVGGVSGLAARLGSSALVGFVALGGVRAMAGYRDTASATPVASERTLTPRTHQPVDRRVDEPAAA